MFKYLNFFGKDGGYLSFDYDETNDFWSGRIDLNTVSQGLIEDYQIYIMEEVWNPNPGQIEYSWPRTSTITGIRAYFNSDGIAKPLSDYSPEAYDVTQIFMYDPISSTPADGLNQVPEPYVKSSYELGATPGGTGTYIINQIFGNPYASGSTATGLQPVTIGATIGYGYSSPGDYQHGSTGAYPYISYTTQPYNRAMQINLAFRPDDETDYKTYLFLEDLNGTAFAKIEIYGEGLNEDERLRALLETLGYDILPSDSIIFDSSDVNEPNPDWDLINRKRKELINEYSNIFPFLGSYKALINIIKFYGYQNLHVKEYWKNVDLRSKNYGKIRQTDIIDIFSPAANYNDARTVPSKIYKKTNQFGLFYNITEATNQYDIDGLPIVKESFTFTIQEVLIKLFALKKKLEQFFLPLNARIIDIVGEAIYFAKYDINVWNDQSRIEAVSLGINPKVSILPGVTGEIEDLRPLYYYGAAVGPDLTVGGTSNFYSWNIQVGNTASTVGPLSSIQTYYLDLVPAGSTTYYRVATTIKTDDDTGKQIYPASDIVDKMITSWKGATESLFGNYNVFQEGGTSGVMRIVSTVAGASGTIFAGWYSNTTTSIPSGTYLKPGLTGGTATYIDISPNGTFGPTGASIGYYGNAFLGYFDGLNRTVYELNDAPDIPVGYSVVLQNDTFDLTWDEAEVSYNQLDVFGSTGPSAGLGYTLFSPYTNSFNVIGWTSISGGPTGAYPIGATYISIPVTVGTTSFPTSLYPYTNQYAWYNIGDRGFVELQWKIEMVPGAGATFSHTSPRLSARDGYQYPIILPYVGKYRVTLKMWDLWNNMSIRVNDDFITVNESGTSDFIGWYQQLQPSYTWNDADRRYPVQSDYSTMSEIWKESHKPVLRWKDYNSTWELPFHPNEEIGIFDITYDTLDTIEFYQTQANTNYADDYIDKFPYTWDLVGDWMSWLDGYHLWWDGTGPKFSQAIVSTLGYQTGSTGSTAYLYVSRGNSTLNIDEGTQILWVDGPTGWTGAIGASAAPSGGTGSIIYSAANARVYVWNGTDWKYTKEELDGIAIPNVKSGSTSGYINAVKKINGINETNPHKVFPDLIAYYDEVYNTSYIPQPRITLVSRDYSHKGQFKFNYGFNYPIPTGGTMMGGTGTTKSFETPFFGYAGDMPATFEIYEIGGTSTILIGPTTSTGMTAAYTTGATNLVDLANELNAASNLDYPGLMEYTYNTVYSAPGWTGGSGPTASIPVKIQAIAKAFTSPFHVDIEYTGSIVGTTYGRPSIQNIDWNAIRIVKYREILPRMTLLSFCYDNSKMKGKKNPIWTITKEGSNSTENIYYNNQYFSYLFRDLGDYTISLQLEDTNGNISKTEKKQIIKIV